MTSTSRSKRLNRIKLSLFIIVNELYRHYTFKMIVMYLFHTSAFAAFNNRYTFAGVNFVRIDRVTVEIAHRLIFFRNLNQPTK
jgi:hypothetical protein